jgi:hypothetical protein
MHKGAGADSQMTALGPGHCTTTVSAMFWLTLPEVAVTVAV